MIHIMDVDIWNTKCQWFVYQKNERHITNLNLSGYPVKKSTV